MTIVNNGWLTSSSALTGNTGLTYVYTSPAGTQLGFESGSENNAEAVPVTSTGNAKSKKKPTAKITAGKNIPPKVFFKFVKSKLDVIDQADLERNLEKLKKLIVVTEEIGQQALFEQFSLQLAITVREQEASASGYNKRIKEEQIERFRKSVQGKVVRFEPLENFPRVIPANVTKQIKRCQDLSIFDTFTVLYIDLVEETKKDQEPLKTTKQKIKEKDPILFGSFLFNPEVYYYIVDWVDEICDLSFRDMLEYLKTEDKEYELDLVPTVDSDYINGIVKEVMDRTERLKRTNSSNFKELMEQEERTKATRKETRGKLAKEKDGIDLAVEEAEAESFIDKVKKRIPFGKTKGVK